MQSRKRNVLVFFVVLAVSVATVIAALRSQSQDQKGSISPALEKAKADFYTITDYDASPPTNATKRTLRQARNKRRNMPAQKGVDPRRFMITEARESSFGTPPFDVPPELALPAATSDAIIIGEVRDAKAFLSEDKTDVYSEFTVSVNEVLKGNSSAPITPGTLIVVERGGGGVRFASGKVILVGNHAKPLPHIGRSYLFFLKCNPEEDFSIITGYELQAGRVSPLDGQSPNGGFFSQYAAYQKYVDADEASFLNEVRGAIALASVNATEKER